MRSNWLAIGALCLLPFGAALAQSQTQPAGPSSQTQATQTPQAAPSGPHRMDPAEREKHRQEMMERHFKALDKNGDGVVSHEEFQARGEEMFKRMDKNGDGKLTAEEMRPPMGHRHGGPRTPGAPAAPAKPAP